MTNRKHSTELAAGKFELLWSAQQMSNGHNIKTVNLI